MARRPDYSRLCQSPWNTRYDRNGMVLARCMVEDGVEHDRHGNGTRYWPDGHPGAGPWHPPVKGEPKSSVVCLKLDERRRRLVDEHVLRSGSSRQRFLSELIDEWLAGRGLPGDGDLPPIRRRVCAVREEEITFRSVPGFKPRPAWRHPDGSVCDHHKVGATTNACADG